MEGSVSNLQNNQPITLKGDYLPGHVAQPNTTDNFDSTNEALAKQQLSPKDQMFVSNWNSTAYPTASQKEKAISKLLANRSENKSIRLYSIFEQIRLENNGKMDEANAFRDQVLGFGKKLLTPEELKKFSDSTKTTSNRTSSTKTDGARRKMGGVIDDVGEAMKLKGGGSAAQRVGFSVLKNLFKTLIPGLIDSENGEGMNNFDFIQAAGEGLFQAGLVKAFVRFSKSVLGKTFLGSAAEIGTSAVTNKSFTDSDNPSLRKYGLLNTVRASVKAGAGAAAFAGTEIGATIVAPGAGTLAAYGAATGLSAGASELAGVAFDMLTSEDQQIVAINIVTDLCAMNGIKFSADLKELAKSPEDARRIADIALAIENNPAIMQALKDCGIDMIHMDNIYALSPNMIFNMIGEAKAQGGTNAMMRYISGEKGIKVNVTTAGVKKYSDPASDLRGTITTYSMEIGTKKMDHYVIKEDKIETQQAGQDNLLEKVQKYQMGENTAYNTVNVKALDSFLSGVPNAKL